MVRVSTGAILAERNAALGSAISSGTGTLQSGDLSFEWKNLGVQVRLLSGQFGDQGTFVSGDATASVGVRLFAADVGYARRAVATDVGTQLYSFFRVGARTIIPIGSTRAKLTIGYWQYVGASGGNSQTAEGREGETQLAYDFSSLPISALIGYRAEIFQTTLGTSISKVTVPEEVRGLRVGLGLVWGRR